MAQLEIWKVYRDHWCDGNPSQTIYYSDDSFLSLQDWVFKNWDSVGGLSFFPTDDNMYENAPYEEITKERYEELQESFPKEVNWGRLSEVEHEDGTLIETEFACQGGQCDL